MAPPSKTHQLLEINIISAQDLELVSKSSMKTYATAWMNPKRKLTSRVDEEGKNNPTWNDKFVFRVEEEFLRQDTSAVMIEIYSNHWFRDVLVGTVRCLVGNLIPQGGRSHNGQPYIGMRFVALQVRRPSGRPQGILNIGVALLDSSMRSMPLYTQPAMSAVGYHDLMEDPNGLQEYESNGAMLRRSRSERSEAIGGFENFSPGSSMIIVTGKVAAKESSILSITECMVPLEGMKKVGKASSVINGAEFREERRPRLKSKRSGKASSVVSDSVMSKGTSIYPPMPPPVLDLQLSDKPESSPAAEKTVDVKTLAKLYDANNAYNADQCKDKQPLIPTIGKPQTDKVPEPEQKYVVGAQAMRKGIPDWNDSEVGPSPSEVAAAMAERRYPLEDNQSSMLDGWSMDESVEGLRSKLDRWRMELPPLQGGGDFSTTTSSYKSSSSSQRTRRTNKEKDDGSFSCFGNIFGMQVQCVCGKPAGAGKKRRPSSSSSSVVSTSQDGSSFL